MEDLKAMWQRHDRQLQQNQHLNELLLRKLNTRNNKDLLRQMSGVEIAGIVVVVISVLWLVVARGRVAGASGLVWICYWNVIGVLLISLAWSLWKVAFIHALDSSKLAVTEMLRRMTRLRLIIVRERLWGGIFALIFLVVPSIVVLTFMLAGIDLTRTNGSILLMQTTAVLLVCTPLGLWIYRRYYIDSIDDIVRNLREISEFEDDPDV